MNKERKCYMCESIYLGGMSCRYPLNEENCPIIKAHEEYLRELKSKEKRLND